jgi:hypothetical protein
MFISCDLKFLQQQIIQAFIVPLASGIALVKIAV